MPYRLKTKKIVMFPNEDADKKDTFKNQTEENTYYGEMTLGVTANTKLELKLFQDIFCEENLRGKLVLELPNGKKKIIQILSVYDIEWGHID